MWSGLAGHNFVNAYTCVGSETMRIAVSDRFRRGCMADFVGSFDMFSGATVCIVELDSKDFAGSSFSTS
jgi:hypothetical protein